MKIYIKLLLVTLFVSLGLSPIYAQLITTGGTITDSDSQTWNNGTWSATPVGTLYSGPIYYNGNPISLSTVSGKLDGSGTFTTNSLYNTSNLTPAGANYRFIICPNASSPCATITIPVVSSDLSSILSAQVQAPRFVASPTARGYLDLEVINNQVPGSYYYNVTMLSGRIWNGSAWVDSGGSGSGTVQPTPQFRLMIQPNAGTQAIAGPASTGQNAVTPLLQGVGNTDLYETGGGNNGAANFFGIYPTGYATFPPTSTSTESVAAQPASGQAIIDRRGNSETRTDKNTVGFEACIPNSSLNSYSQCLRRYYDSTATPNDAHTFNFYQPDGAGFDLGFPGAGSAQSWTTRWRENSTENFFTRGITQSEVDSVNCFKIGDCAAKYIYLNGDGGSQAGGDEGTVGESIAVHENTSYFHGTIATGGTTGSNLLTTNFVSGMNHFTDGAYLIDTDRPSFDLGTISAVSHVSVIPSGQTFTEITVPNSVTPSTAWGVFDGPTNSAANGQYQIPVTQTVTVDLGTSPSSPGNFTVGSACLVGGFSEPIPITAVGTPSAGKQSITFTTRYGWDATSTLIMQGSLCGQYASPTGSSWKSSAAIVGALDATHIIVAQCYTQGCTTTNNAAVVGVGVDLTSYQGAEVIGTSNGTPNTVQLGYNTTAWTVGDHVENPHSASVNVHAFKVLFGQTTAENGQFSDGASIQDDGPAATNSLLDLIAAQGSSGQPADAGILFENQGNGGRINSAIKFNMQPNVILDALNTPGTAELPIYIGPTSASCPTTSIVDKLDGSFQFFGCGNYVPLRAENVPPVPTVLGQIPIATSLAGGLSGPIAYTNTLISGDCTMSSTGVMTCGQKGRAILVAGTVTVSSTLVTATSVIQLTNCVSGGTAGLLSVGTVVDNTSFVINSASAIDTSTICWSVN